MTIEELRRRVNGIEAMAGDPEAAHAAEDELMREWIESHTLYAVRSQFQRLWAMDFPRWCA